METEKKHAKQWKLNVQGVILTLDAPTIIAREAISKAGFNPDQGWHIFLKVVGQPKQLIELTAIIDLKTPGLEKVRLTPKEVNNGEAETKIRREFELLAGDCDYLDKHFVRWEAVIEEKRRWLLIYGYAVPAGYNEHTVTLALEIPDIYPRAQIDMFHFFPPLTLATGHPIPSTQIRTVILNDEFHGWSRHRGPASLWNPDTDNVVTHLALVEGAILKEVSQ